jgi:hypothetical protein
VFKAAVKVLRPLSRCEAAVKVFKAAVEVSRLLLTLRLLFSRPVFLRSIQLLRLRSRPLPRLIQLNVTIKPDV